MTIIGHIRLILSMTLLLLPALAMAQSPFGYIPLNTNKTASDAVDILVEPLTYTPDFYGGRAEPISGGQVKLVAIAEQPINANSLSYRWSVAGKTLNEVPEAKNQMMIVNLPVNPNLVVKVEVFDEGGKLLATKTENIPMSNMTLAFYENNPLRGLSKVAVAQDLIMVGEEVSIKAVPYFSNSEDFASNLKTYWTVAGLEQAPNNPWELTIERSQLDRDGLINFVMQNHRTLESAEKTFTLKL